jgi:hypothetical protein
MFRASWFMTVFVLVLVAVSADEKASLRKARRNVLHVESSFVESLWGQEANDGTEQRESSPSWPCYINLSTSLSRLIFLFVLPTTAAEMEKVNAEAVDSHERELFDRQLQSSRMLFQF